MFTLQSVDYRIDLAIQPVNWSIATLSNYLVIVNDW